jgi:mRNA interferase HigB
VRIIKESFLVEVVKRHPKTARYLDAWRKTVRSANWQNLVDVRKTYPATDGVTVKSGRQVLVFNVCGNEFRLIVAAHYDKQRVYTLRLLSHAEYGKNKWKDEL